MTAPPHHRQDARREAAAGRTAHDICGEERQLEASRDRARDEWALEEGLEESFPASDPVSIVQPHRSKRGSRRRDKQTEQSQSENREVTDGNGVA
jgi:hypothetical protein